MDPVALAGMLFTLILTAMVGGFILLWPITRRLGAMLEQRLKGPRSEVSSAEFRQLEAVVHSLREELEQLSERQAFTDALQSEPRPPLMLKDESPEKRVSERLG